MTRWNTGDALPARDYTITREDLVRYAHASGDHNPIHTDEDVARSVGLPGVIAHGMYTLALAGRAVAEWADGAEVVSLGGKFTNPVVVPADGGARITVSGAVREVGDERIALSLEVTCEGEKVLGNPRAVVRA